MNIIFIGEATEKNNDSVVDSAIHGNYDDKMILPDAGKVTHPTLPHHLVESPPSLFSLLLKLWWDDSHKACQIIALSPLHMSTFSIFKSKSVFVVYLYFDVCICICILYLANCLL